MSKIDDLIKSIISEDKITNQFEESRVYTDEPILFTASQMRNYTPPIYREMREIASSKQLRNHPAAEIFYRQAKFMEYFEEDYEYRGEFFSYFPTYQSMNNFQLRGYFSWRSEVRRGNIKAVSLSFACIYLYELINQIGVTSPADGYRKMKDFTERYMLLDRRITSYASSWLRDYVVYYGLDKALLRDRSIEERDRAMMTILRFKEHSADEVTRALCEMSAYKLTESKFYKQQQDDVSKVVYNVFSRLYEYYSENRGRGVFKALFGSRLSYDCIMFMSAVFYSDKVHPDCVYEINELYKYVCKDGRWTYEQSHRYLSRNEKISGILKTIDCLMRRKYSYKYPLKPVEISDVYLKIIVRAIEDFCEEKRQAAIPKIEIDTSVLQSIRETSLVTQNKLIVEEQETESEEEADKTVDEPIQPSTDVSPLSESEIRLVAAVLYGGDYAGMLKAQGLMPSVFVDTVNEKLFDIFADTVLSFEGQTIVPVEDYAEELKGIITQ